VVYNPGICCPACREFVGFARIYFSPGNWPFPCAVCHAQLRFSEKREWILLIIECATVIAVNMALAIAGAFSLKYLVLPVIPTVMLCANFRQVILHDAK
jgi:hypothetical protein